MNFKNIQNTLKAVLKYEKRMEIDTQFLSRFVYTFGFLQFYNIYAGLKTNSIVQKRFGISSMIIMFIIGTLIPKIKNKRRFKRVVIAFSCLMFYIVLIAAASCEPNGVSNLWCLMAVNGSFCICGIIFGIVYLGLIIIFLILFFWTPLGPVLQEIIWSGFLKLIIHNPDFVYPFDYSVYSKEYRILYPIIFIAWTLCIFLWDVYVRINQINQEKIEFRLEHDLKAAKHEIKQTVFEGLKSTIKVIDEKDDYTKLHSERVALYSQMIAQEYGIKNEEELDDIYKNALLHDIGKIAVPDSILKKGSKLTEEEFAVMKNHTVWGGKILNNLEILPTAGIGAKYHHEKLNGTGYPNGVKEDEIPFIGKIISVADALDAMNSNRVYRQHCSKEYIISEFEKYSGIQFDKTLVEVACKLIKEGRIQIEE